MESLSKILAMPWESLGWLAGQQLFRDILDPDESLTIFNGEIESSTKTSNNKKKDNIGEPNSASDVKKDSTANNMAFEVDKNLVKTIKYNCKHCDFNTSYKSSLHQHVQSIHKGVKYSCEHCDHKATKKSHLRIHVQSIHNGIKHSCKYCDYKATTKGNLQRHVVSVHDGVKHSCEYCDYKATTKGSL